MITTSKTYPHLNRTWRYLAASLIQAEYSEEEALAYEEAWLEAFNESLSAHSATYYPQLGEVHYDSAHEAPSEEAIAEAQEAAEAAAERVLA